MLKRKCEKRINTWIKESNKALLIYGARQVGKTYIIRKCLKENKCDYVEFNLFELPELAKLLDKINNTNELIAALSLFTNKKLIKNKTIIFFDEIQECKEIVTKIKFLVDEGSYKYVLSGSLLGVEIRNIKSAPVGYLDSFTMYPLDFEEFLSVFNISNELFKELENSFNNRLPVDDIVNERMLQIFNTYLIVGGMPDAINKYLESNSLFEVDNVQKNIINRYKLDFTKYEEENKKLLITKAYDLIPAEINEKNKRFNLKSLDDYARAKKINDTFVWLDKAGVALPVYNTTEPTYPLLLNKKSNLFKLFLSDVGLLTSMYGNTTKVKILNKEKDINNGAIYENVVAQELIAHNISLYYFNSKKQGEIDFVIELDNKVVPIEVKSGKDYFRHNALNNLLNNYPIDNAYVFANTNVKIKEKIIYYPIYMIMFVKNKELEDITFPKIDLRDLQIK